MKPQPWLLLIELALSIILVIACKKDVVTYNAPLAHAGVDATVYLPADSIMLDGRGSKKTDLGIKGQEWRKIAGPNSFNIKFPRSITTMVTGLVEGIYAFEIKVFDSLDQISRDTMQVTVFRKNSPPVANAGRDTTIYKPANAAFLDGRNSTDPDHDIVKYRWRYVSGPPSYMFYSADSAYTQVLSLQVGKYKFELTVIDSFDTPGTDTVTVIVAESTSNNARVEIQCSPIQYVSTKIGAVDLYAPATAQNEQGQLYSSNDRHVWTQLSGPTNASIKTHEETTAQVKITNLVKGKYVFQVKASFYNKDVYDTTEINLAEPEIGEYIFESTWQPGNWEQSVTAQTPERPDLFFDSFHRKPKVYILLKDSTNWIECLEYGLYEYQFDNCDRKIVITTPDQANLLIGQKLMIKVKFE